MKIDFNRLNKLAGLPVSNKSSRSLNEGYEESKPDFDDYLDKWHGMDKDGNWPEDEPEGGDPEFAHLSDAEPHEDDFVAPDENDAIKKIIAEEVENVMQDLNLTSGWIYGGDKPKRSVQGRLNHGGYLKGPGFK